MNFPQKRNVNVAAVSKRKHDLSHYHVGTTDFGRMKPIECKYMVPGDEFNFNINVETRVLNAMPSPTIGQFDFVYRAFFVPIHNIWQPFYDYLKNQPTAINGVLTNVTSAPYIKLNTFMNYLMDADNELTELVSDPTSESQYDFSQQPSPNIKNYYKFTRKGRILFDFLTSLGINIPLNSPSNQQKLYIILPLVCFWKFYFDWIVPSRFIHEHNDFIQLFIDKLNNNVGTEVSSSDFFKFLLHEPLAYYLDDFFTTSTFFPFSDPVNQQDTITIVNPDTGEFDAASVYSNNEHTYLEGGSGALLAGAENNLNMYTLQTLGKLQDLLNRNLIAGTKVQDWLLTEFGIKPNNDALHLSTYLGCKRNTLQVADVISNADTQAQGGTPLGAYAGYVNNRNKFDFSYKCNEHGFFFITAELVPRASYYQGLAAQFDMADRFDFFQPEFDNQQGAPIPFRRLYFAQKYYDQTNPNDTPFGFQLQYADMKFAPDVISGDFNTRFGGELKSWFLGRDMSYLVSDPEFHLGITENFCLVKTEYQNWHYIFSDMTDEIDPFLVAFYIQNHAMRPMKSITEGFEPTYQQSGKNVSLDFSGSVK